VWVCLPSAIRSGAMSLVFNDMVFEEDQRKICCEYDITMNEDLDKKFEEWKIRDEECAKLRSNYKNNFGSEPKIKGDWEQHGADKLDGDVN